MNLEKLFKMQKELDDHIMDEHPDLKGQDNLDWKILALQVELGECANEWRGFKKWSNNQKPRTVIHTNVGATAENAEYLSCTGCGKKYDRSGDWFEILLEKEICPQCRDCLELFRKKNPLLEEYVDGLHFILSIGLEIGYANKLFKSFGHGKYTSATVNDQYLNVFEDISNFRKSIEEDEENMFLDYEELIFGFIGLGEMLGFTWEQVEKAYFDKNAVNHERQKNGY